jgi:hypothetical protein
MSAPVDPFLLEEVGATLPASNNVWNVGPGPYNHLTTIPTLLDLVGLGELQLPLPTVRWLTRNFHCKSTPSPTRTFSRAAGLRA